VSKIKFPCLCCGWDQLDFKPYENYPECFVSTKNLKPPYHSIWGAASYEVCECCGFEFGNDDDPGGSLSPETFSSYRRDWIKRGAKWLQGFSKPKGWVLERQLARLID